MKALRNEFPKFYPQIPYRGPKVEEKPSDAGLPVSTKSSTTIYTDGKREGEKGEGEGGRWRGITNANTKTKSLQNMV